MITKGLRSAFMGQAALLALLSGMDSIPQPQPYQREAIKALSAPPEPTKKRSRQKAARKARHAMRARLK